MGGEPLLIILVLIGSNGVRISAIECSLSRRFAEECNPTTGAHFLELSVSIYLFNVFSRENEADCNPGGVLVRSCNCMLFVCCTISRPPHSVEFAESVPDDHVEEVEEDFGGGEEEQEEVMLNLNNNNNQDTETNNNEDDVDLNCNNNNNGDDKNDNSTPRKTQKSSRVQCKYSIWYIVMDQTQVEDSFWYSSFTFPSKPLFTFC